MTLQLPLGLHLRDETTLDSFFTGSNENVLDAIFRFINGYGNKFLLVCGENEAGKTHLLQATALKCQEYGLSSLYLPLKELQAFSSHYLDGLENLNVICIDDLQSVIGNSDWEEAILEFFTHLEKNNRRAIFSIDKNLHDLNITNSKLQRFFLSNTTLLELIPMTRQQKIQALSLRAGHRGMKINERVAKFLLKSCSMDLSNLFSFLDKLDQVSLVEQKKLTLPFVKEVLKMQTLSAWQN